MQIQLENSLKLGRVVQEGYNVNLLDSEPQNSSPTNRNPPSNLGHSTGTEAAPSSKEALSRPYEPAEYESKPKPWHRQGKWRIAMLIGAIVVIGAIVGGAVGGTVGHNSKNDTSTGPSTASLPVQSTANVPTVSSNPDTGSSENGGAGASTSGGGPGAGQTGNTPSPTPTPGLDSGVGAGAGHVGVGIGGNDVPAFATGAPVAGYVS